MNKTYTLHEDPGHGWLAVPMAELFQLGIADCISSCSYLDDKTAYLEEDLDAGTFINTARANGWIIRREDIRTVYQENTPIREYRSYPASPEWKTNLKQRSAA